MGYHHAILVSPQPHDIVLQRDKIVVRHNPKLKCGVVHVWHVARHALGMLPLLVCPMQPLKTDT